jgi:hypothetical protein
VRPRDATVYRTRKGSRRIGMPGEPASPDQEAARLYEETEAATARAMETLVASGGFSALLVSMVENVAAVTRLGADTMDLVLRNLRVASRRDIVRLARQLARTEDKLERVLQEVEGLRAELNTPAKRNSRSPNRRPAAR